MYIAGRWADRQLSRLELVIAVIILSLVLAGLIQHMLKLFAHAERSLLTISIININSALQYRAAGYVLEGDFVSIKGMLDMNPFTMIETGQREPGRPIEAGSPQMTAGMANIRVPENYLGELDGPDPASIDGGSWYFDKQARRLVYRVDNTEYFESNLTGAPRVSYTVGIDYEDRNNNNQFDPRIDEFHSIRLQAVNEYTWQL